MSRLDSAIRRLEAQRDCLDAALDMVADVPGPILEFGLGNGRTYDHLRQRAGARAIYVFERRVAAHPDCVPADEYLFLGDFGDTLPRAVALLGRTAALAHLDVGSGDDAESRARAARVAASLPQLLIDGGVVASDQPCDVSFLSLLPLPADVAPGRYYLYRCRGA